MASRRGRSAASRVFTALVVAGVLIAGGVAALLVWEGQRATNDEAVRVTQAVAQTLAHSPAVRAALAAGDDAAATAELQPLAEDVMDDARVDFVTVMDTAGIRITHRDPAEIGRHYLGTIPADAAPLTEQ